MAVNWNKKIYFHLVDSGGDAPCSVLTLMRCKPFLTELTAMAWSMIIKLCNFLTRLLQADKWFEKQVSSVGKTEPETKKLVDCLFGSIETSSH